MHPLVCSLFGLSLLAITLPAVAGHLISQSTKMRTIVTTDMEQDDLASMIRYILYTNDLDTQGIIYSSSRYHWAGNGNGTSLRWTGTQTIQDIILKAYAHVFRNLRQHDPSYPTAAELLSTVKVGNIDFESEMDHDTEGSDLILSLLLDDDPRPLYLQAWGGTNTIARALKSAEERLSGSRQWMQIKSTIARKAVIMASGFQDDTYANYIALKWPHIQVVQLSAGYSTWGYNCNRGQGNVRGVPDNLEYFSGSWIKEFIEIGPYGKLYRSWLDGQHMLGDPEDIFGSPAKATSGWCKPLCPYDFLSEGDNVAFNPLLSTGIQEPAHPNLGSWGGRAKQHTAYPNLWVMVDSEKNETGTEVGNYTTSRWVEAAQNDFAARIQWTVMPKYNGGNHAPSVKILNGSMVEGHPGETVTLASMVHDPDGDTVTTSWWQYFEEGTYPGSVRVNKRDEHDATVTLPTDAKPGQTVSIILQGTDDGQFRLSRYGRVFIEIV